MPPLADKLEAQAQELKAELVAVEKAKIRAVKEGGVKKGKKD